MGRRERRSRGVCCIVCGRKCGQSSPRSFRRRSGRECKDGARAAPGNDMFGGVPFFSFGYALGERKFSLCSPVGMWRGCRRGCAGQRWFVACNGGASGRSRGKLPW